MHCFFQIMEWVTTSFIFYIKLANLVLNNDKWCLNFDQSDMLSNGERYKNLSVW